MQWETDGKNGTFRPVKRQRNSLGMQGCAGSPTFRTFVRQATMPGRIACSAGVRIPSERCGLRLL